MSQRNQYRDRVFWLRFGCFMGIVFGVFLVRASATGAVALLVASGWVMWSPASRAAVALGIALLAVGISIIAGVYEIEDPLFSGIWAIGAGSVVLASCRGLRALAAALAAPPTPDELREQEFEDLIEDIRSSTMMTDPNHIQFATQGFLGFFSGSSWRGRLRDADAVFESTTRVGDDPLDYRQVLIVQRGEIEIELRGTTTFGGSLFPPSCPTARALSGLFFDGCPSMRFSVGLNDDHQPRRFLSSLLPTPSHPLFRTDPGKRRWHG